MNDKPPWASVVGQYGTRGTTEADPFDEEVEIEPIVEETGYVAFGTVPSNRRSDPMIQIKRRTGAVEAFGYPYLTRIQFDPSEGLKMEFAQCSLLVRGRNLHKLLNALTGHRVRFLQEYGDRIDDLPHDETVITRIEIERT